MSYEHLRRSSRIPKELAILLTGSDMDGKGFSEMTKTVLLSRHGAGLISSYKFSAEQEIIVRYLDANKEAVVRVVGRIGSEGETFTYGVAFVDPSNINFWDIDFAPVSETEKRARNMKLTCSTCKESETVEQSDVESDVFLINDGIVRYCKQCHDSTLWKRPAESADEQAVLVGAGQNLAATATGQAPSTAKSLSAPSVPATRDAATSGSVQSPGRLQDSPNAHASSAYASPSDRKTAVPLDNRRKHPRTKVSYKACIRRSGFADDVVTCDDMSKGGISFKSRKKYFEGTDIEVAVPYAPGGNAIFVPAQVVWVVEITKDKQYRCGVSYRRVSRAS